MALHLAVDNINSLEAFMLKKLNLSVFSQPLKYFFIRPNSLVLRNPGRDISFPIFTRKEIETKKN